MSFGIPAMMMANQCDHLRRPRKEHNDFRCRNSLKTFITHSWPACIGAAILFQPGSILACAACYGQSDSPMAAGMNWGILSLLGMIGLVLGGVAGFFVFLARRSLAMAKSQGEALSAKPAEGGTAGTQVLKNRLGVRGGLDSGAALAKHRKQCVRPGPGPGSNQFLISNGRS
jgi:hypothetical protein